MIFEKKLKIGLKDLEEQIRLCRTENTTLVKQQISLLEELEKTKKLVLACAPISFHGKILLPERSQIDMLFRVRSDLIFKTGRYLQDNDFIWDVLKIIGEQIIEEREKKKKEKK